MLTPKNNYENDTFLEKRYYQDFLSLAKDTNLLHVREAGLLLKDPEYTSPGKRLKYNLLASMTHILAILHAVFQGPRSDTQKADGFDEMVDAYLEQNIRNHTTIDQAASAFGVSPRHFVKNFKKRFDVTYSKYMYRQRMLFSKTLLQSNRYTISEIANHLGFCDQSYFSNCFYKEFGLYPNEYRKSVKVQTKSDK